MAATRRAATADHGMPRADRRRSTMSTPLTLVKMTHVNVSSASSAASRGAHDSGGPMTIVGASSTRAPAASSSCVNRCACVAARVTTIVRPSSGRSCPTGLTRALTRHLARSDAGR
jgi:hypothetical protein